MRGQYEVDHQQFSQKSIIAFYFSKFDLGITCYDSEWQKIQTSFLYHVNYYTKKTLRELIQRKQPSAIITNNSKHQLVEELKNFSIKVIGISEKCLKDELIQSNLNELQTNSTRLKHEQKSWYITQMKEDGESFSSANDKFKSLGLLIYHLFNQSMENIRRNILLDQIEYFNDNLLYRVSVGNYEREFLQLTKEQIHPSLIKGKGRSKEGISFLSLYQSTFYTSGAKKYFTSIFYNPIFNRVELQRRYKLIQWMKLNLKGDDLPKIFRNIHGIDNLLKRFSKMQVLPEDWVKMIRSIQNCIIFHKILCEKLNNCYEKPPELLMELIDEIQREPIGEAIAAVYSTLQLDPFSIKKSFDVKLDELKNTYDSMPSLLTMYAKEQNWQFEFRIVFITQIGYLIRLPHQDKLPQVAVEQQWQEEFSNNSGKYFSNKLTQILDEEYGDIYGQIIDREGKIIFDMETLINEESKAIQKMYWAICELECFYHISQMSRNMCFPKLSQQGLIICNGWHLLLSQKAVSNHSFSFNHQEGPYEEVKNNEYNMVNTNYTNRVVVITGPNSSGKSVYIKQTAMLIYLAHVGLYIPAQFAEIPLTDRIYVLEKSSSSYNKQNGFKFQIKSLSKVMVPGQITNRSLILIDELASKIDLQISLKMLYATISFLGNNTHHKFLENEKLSSPNFKFKIPLSFIVTHLTDLMLENLLNQTQMIRFLKTEMTPNFVKLFKIIPGIGPKKYGIKCAEDILPSNIIDASEKIYDHFDQLI